MDVRGHVAAIAAVFGACLLPPGVGAAAVVDQGLVAAGDGDASWKGRMITPAELDTIPHAKIPTLPNGVPMILHQTWRSHELLPQHKPFFSSWDKFLPNGWIHVLWTDEETESFVRANAPAEFIETYDLYVYPIEKIDTFRYVLLDVYGGVYADLDNELFAAPAWPDMDNCHVYLAEVCCGIHTERQMERYVVETGSLIPEGEDRPTPLPVQNSLMVSTRGHPFWKKLIHLAVERGPANHIWQRWTGLHPIHLVVGVDLLSSANYLYGSKNGDVGAVCELPKEDWHGGIEGAPPPRFVQHHGTHVWKTFKHNLGSIVVVVIVGIMVLVGCGYFALSLTGNQSVIDSVKERTARVVNAVPIVQLRIGGVLLTTAAFYWYFTLPAD
jgi:hypothetical protein